MCDYTIDILENNEEPNICTWWYLFGLLKVTPGCFFMGYDMYRIICLWTKQ